MGARVGIVGGGQLGRMLALAGVPLDIACTVIDPSPDAGAAIAARQIVADFDNLDALAELAQSSDVVTFEFENVPAPALEAIARKATIAPPASALEVSQDRLHEKQMFERIGIATAPYAPVDSLAELESAVAAIGLPAILKTRRLGYDGKGQVRIERLSELAHAWESVDHQPSILEGLVKFTRELSVIAVRSSDGETAVYPLTENVHSAGILRRSTAPAPAVEYATSEAAHAYSTKLLAELNYVGVLALELFETSNGLIANEFAPRVHNSGHWTIDAAPTSQFENHLRAVLGMPLGETGPAEPCVMLNLIGGAPPEADVIKLPGVHLHMYGKQPRPGRKIGHITVTGVDLASTLAVLEPLVANSAR